MARDPSQALRITRTSTLNPNPSPNPNPNPNRNPHRVSSRLTIQACVLRGDHGRERLELGVRGTAAEEEKADAHHGCACVGGVVGSFVKY